jgi:hypothetical protein
MASLLPWPEASAFARGQHVVVRGLSQRADLNGLVAVVLADSDGERVAVRVGSERMRVRRANLERTEAAPQEGTSVDGQIMMAGEWFGENALLGKLFNSGDAAGDAFSALRKHEQADVLAGRRSLVVADHGVPASSPPGGCPPGARTVREQSGELRPIDHP